MTKAVRRSFRDQFGECLADMPLAGYERIGTQV